MKLEVIKKRYGVDVVEKEDAHFSLSLFLTDLTSNRLVDELIDKLQMAKEFKSYFFSLSFNASAIDITDSCSIISDQECEYYWYFENIEIEKLLMDWKNIKIKGKFPTFVSVKSKLVNHLDYLKIINKYIDRK